jgi:hypothetical protein
MVDSSDSLHCCRAFAFAAWSAAAADIESGDVTGNQVYTPAPRPTLAEANAAALAAAAAAGKRLTAMNSLQVNLGIASENSTGLCTPNNPVCSLGTINYSEQQFALTDNKTVQFSVDLNGIFRGEQNETIGRFRCSYYNPFGELLKGFQPVARVKSVGGSVDLVTFIRKLEKPLECMSYAQYDPLNPNKPPPALPNCTSQGLVKLSKAKCATNKFRGSNQCTRIKADVTITERGGSCFPDAAASTIIAVVDCDNGQRYEFTPENQGEGINWGKTIIDFKA